MPNFFFITVYKLAIEKDCDKSLNCKVFTYPVYFLPNILFLLKYLAK